MVKDLNDQFHELNNKIEIHDAEIDGWKEKLLEMQMALDKNTETLKTFA